jgi:hypothetical protein
MTGCLLVVPVSHLESERYGGINGVLIAGKWHSIVESNRPQSRLASIVLVLRSEFRPGWPAFAHLQQWPSTTPIQSSICRKLQWIDANYVFTSLPSSLFTLKNASFANRPSVAQKCLPAGCSIILSSSFTTATLTSCLGWNRPKLR